jgi:Rps23 Pro-64 3,4-dihydroxylase Tpa1-like proline 4-hydroxylase
MNYEELSPCIISIKDAVTNSKEIIEVCSSEKYAWRDAEIGQNGSFLNNNKIRNNKILDLPIEETSDPVLHSAFQKIWDTADYYGKIYDVSFSRMEDPQLLKYSENNNFYKKHSDDGPHTSRVFSCLLYLNDVDSGGETYFNNFDLTIKPEAGKIVLFPANYAYSHEARSPKSGEKFVMATWFEKVVLNFM